MSHCLEHEVVRYEKRNETDGCLTFGEDFCLKGIGDYSTASRAYPVITFICYRMHMQTLSSLKLII